MSSDLNIDQKQPMNVSEKGLNLLDPQQNRNKRKLMGDQIDGWDEGDEVYSQAESVQNSVETESSTL